MESSIILKSVKHPKIRTYEKRCSVAQLARCLPCPSECELTSFFSEATAKTGTVCGSREGRNAVSTQCRRRLRHEKVAGRSSARGEDTERGVRRS